MEAIRATVKVVMVLLEIAAVEEGGGEVRTSLTLLKIIVLFLVRSFAPIIFKRGRLHAPSADSSNES